MSSLLAIDDALADRLKLLTSEPEVAWGDLAYTPRPDLPYLTAKMLGRNRSPMGIGPNTPQLWQGSYTLVVVNPAQEGPRRALKRADAVLGWFKRGLTLTATGGIIVTIESGTIQPTYALPDYLNVPVVVAWFAVEPPGG